MDIGLKLASIMHKVKQSTHTHMVHLLMQTMRHIYHGMLRAWGPDHACHVSIGFAQWFYTLADAHQGAANQTWYVKPKFHLMEELFQYTVFELGNPLSTREYFTNFETVKELITAMDIVQQGLEMKDSL